MDAMRKPFAESDIDAVAFDIDGTLYPSFRLYRKLPLYFLKHLDFFLAFNKVRRTLHKAAHTSTETGGEGRFFYKTQALLLADAMRISMEEAEQKISRIIYEGLKPYFLKIKPFAHIHDVFSGLRKAGIKVALLSDFPPEQKGSVWGLAPYCSAVLSSERSGALKPSTIAFTSLSTALGLPPQRILYVGNSLASDAIGAASAGMKTALILSPLDFFNLKKKRACDIYFYSYRQFLTDVIDCNH